MLGAGATALPLKVLRKYLSCLPCSCNIPGSVSVVLGAGSVGPDFFLTTAPWSNMTSLSLDYVSKGPVSQ